MKYSHTRIADEVLNTFKLLISNLRQTQPRDSVLGDSPSMSGTNL